MATRTGRKFCKVQQHYNLYFNKKVRFKPNLHVGESSFFHVPTSYALKQIERLSGEEKLQVAA